MTITTPQNHTLRERTIGVAYTVNGQSALFAPIRNSDGLLFTPNQVLYPDAFAAPGAMVADVRVSFTKAGVESDVILRTRLPSYTNWFPNANEEDVLLEVWHEFDAPEPIKTTRAINWAMAKT